MENQNARERFFQRRVMLVKEVATREINVLEEKRVSELEQEHLYDWRFTTSTREPVIFHDLSPEKIYEQLILQENKQILNDALDNSLVYVSKVNGELRWD